MFRFLLDLKILILAYPLLAIFSPRLLKLAFKDDKGQEEYFRKKFRDRDDIKKGTLFVAITIMFSYFPCAMGAGYKLDAGMFLALAAYFALCSKKLFLKAICWLNKGGFKTIPIPMVIIALAPGGFHLAIIALLLLATAFICDYPRDFEAETKNYPSESKNATERNTEDKNKGLKDKQTESEAETAEYSIHNKTAIDHPQCNR